MTDRRALQGARAPLRGVESSRAAAHVVLGSGTGRRRKDSPVDQLERYSARLDELIQAERLAPAMSHRERERRISEGEAIGEGIRNVFRNARPARCAPLFQETVGNRSRAGW